MKYVSFLSHMHNTVQSRSKMFIEKGGRWQEAGKLIGGNRNSNTGEIWVWRLISVFLGWVLYGLMALIVNKKWSQRWEKEVQDVRKCFHRRSRGIVNGGTRDRGLRSEGWKEELETGVWKLWRKVAARQLMKQGAYTEARRRIKCRFFWRERENVWRSTGRYTQEMFSEGRLFRRIHKGLKVTTEAKHSVTKMSETQLLLSSQDDGSKNYRCA